MTLSEAGASQGEIPFDCLVTDQPLPRAENPLSLVDIASLCVRGGWPGNLDTPTDLAQELPRQYVLSLINEDIERYDDVARDPVKMDLLVRSLARNNQTLVSKKTLLADVGQLSAPTLNSYLNVLTNLFVLASIPAWSPAVRSRARLRTAEKVRFVDPSLALAALRIGTAKLAADWETFGLMFECLVTRDVLAFAEVTGARVFHYREAANQGRREHEVDLVIETSDDEYSLVEVKLNTAQLDDAEASLSSVRAKLVADGAPPPSAQSITCGTVPYAYTTERATLVVPIGCLGP
jgi:predicted AAA+ superfamily ATPase